MNLQNYAPLTRAQHSMYVGHLYHGSLPFHTAEWLVIEGDLDRNIFHQAVDRTFAEAKSLHWRAYQADHKFYRIDDVERPQPKFIDLSHYNDQELQTWLDEQVIPPFDLHEGYLYDYTFVHLADDRYGLFLRAHHVALDGYAYGLLIHRFIDYYQAIKNGAPLKHKPFDHYEKFVQEETAYLESEQSSKDLAFWTEHFSSENAPKKRLKRKLKHPFTQGYRFEDLIDLETHQKLSDLATNLRVPSAMIIMATFMGYMHHQQTQEIPTFGVPFLSRIGTSALRIPCLTMNILPLRLDAQGTETLNDIVKLLMSKFNEIRPHQKAYFEQVRFVLKDFEPFENILFGSIVNWLPFPLPETFEGCKLKKNTISAGPIEDFDMFIANKMIDGQERLSLAIDGHPELYTVQSLEAYWHDYMNMLKMWLDQPETQLRSLKISLKLPE